MRGKRFEIKPNNFWWFFYHKADNNSSDNAFTTTFKKLNAFVIDNDENGSKITTSNVYDWSIWHQTVNKLDDNERKK